MRPLIQFSDIALRLQNSLLSSIGYFRRCEDSSGLESFLNSIQDIEILLNPGIAYVIPGFILDNIRKSLRHICGLMENQDITGLTDVVEFELYPLVKDILEEGLKQNENSRA
ncbi:MAG TPA: hypothetical protein VHP38_10790 [Ruminiclostridium sp.]|nr:hypothetical protein [Ruminiclostridium sp.]